MNSLSLIILYVFCKVFLERFTSLVNENILPSTKTKLRALADNELKVVQMIISVFDDIEKIVRKGENAGHQHFVLFLLYFSKVRSILSSKAKLLRYNFCIL